jgi:hypothetical protein
MPHYVTVQGGIAVVQKPLPDGECAVLREVGIVIPLDLNFLAENSNREHTYREA